MEAVNYLKSLTPEQRENRLENLRRELRIAEDYDGPRAREIAEEIEEMEALRMETINIGTDGGDLPVISQDWPFLIAGCGPEYCLIEVEEVPYEGTPITPIYRLHSVGNAAECVEEMNRLMHANTDHYRHIEVERRFLRIAPAKIKRNYELACGYGLGLFEAYRRVVTKPKGLLPN